MIVASLVDCVLALLIGIQALPQERVVVEYVALPGDAESASVLDWEDGAAPTESERVRIRAGERLMLPHAPGRLVVVIFSRSDNAYVVDGPFVWPQRTELRRGGIEWRKTIGGARAAGMISHQALFFTSAARHAGQGLPACFWQDDMRWTCFGVPLRTPVAIVWTRQAGQVWWNVVSETGGETWRRSDWARLLVATAATPEPREVRFTLAHAVAAPSRIGNVRLAVAPIPDAHIIFLERAMAWIAAQRPPPAAWAEVRARENAPRYLSLAELASGPTTLPVPVVLEPERTLEGRALSGAQPAVGALITLSRLIDPPPQPGDRTKPRRVTVTEVTSDSEGRFRFEGLGDIPYEIAAWHPQLGRSSVIVEGLQSSVDVRLTPAGIARGRVLVRGKPASGVDVFSVPDMAAFAAADDPMDVKGGDTRTGADGRFLVTVAPAGGGELRIGGPPFGLKRIPLSPSPLPVVDVGDVELADAITVRVVLDQDPACALRAAGPLGRAGLQVVLGVRTGPGLFQLAVPEEGAWQLDLDCPDTPRALMPSTVHITRSVAGKDVRLMLR